MWQIFPSKSKSRFWETKSFQLLQWNVLENIKLRELKKSISNKIYFIGDFSPEAVQLFLIV